MTDGGAELLRSWLNLAEFPVRRSPFSIHEGQETDEYASRKVTDRRGDGVGVIAGARGPRCG